MKLDIFSQVYFQFISDVQQAAYKITEDFKPEGITQLEYSVLEFLYFFKGNKACDIRKELMMNEYKTRSVLKSLIQKRLIERSLNPDDKRSHVYEITRKGKGKLDACYFQVMKKVQEEYAHLDDEVLKNLTECMSYISKVMY